MFLGPPGATGPAGSSGATGIHDFAFFDFNRIIIFCFRLIIGPTGPRY